MKSKKQEKKKGEKLDENKKRSRPDKYLEEDGYYHKAILSGPKNKKG